MKETRTLGDLLALPAGAELDAAVANALGDNLRARDEDFKSVKFWRSELSDEDYAQCFSEEIRLLYVGSDASYGSVLNCAWQNREVDGVRKPYAAALEAAVAAYRRPAPPYSTDGNAMLALTKAMYERGYDLELLGRGSEPLHARFYKKGRRTRTDWQSSYSEPLTKTRAALAALEGSAQ